jgi:hypothetical protein
MQPWIPRALAAAVVVALAGAGCVGPRKQREQAARREYLLTRAGFRQIPADRPERAAALERLEAGQVVPVVHDERTFYVYPDREICHCLYVGRADEYDSYLNLLKQDKSPEPPPLQWNDGRFSNSSALLNPGIWGAWDYWE